MLTLTAFGTLDLRDENGRPRSAVLAQSKRAALLAYLVVHRPGSFHRRDALLALFWPELDQIRGRSALSQALSFLRREVGEGVLLTRGPEEVGVDPGAIHCDVLAFRKAVESGRWAEALEAHRGDLLEGLHVAGAIPFSDWVDRERTRLREAAAKAAWAMAHERIAGGELVEAERTAQRALHLVPTDESPVRAFVEALARAGDRGAALRFYDRFVGILARELEVDPAPETVAVARSVRKGGLGAGDSPSPGRAEATIEGTQSRADRGLPPGVPAEPSRPAAAVEPSPPLPGSRPGGRRRRKLLVPVAGLAGALAVLGYLRFADTRVAGPGTLLGTGLGPYPRVVVADFAFPPDPELGRMLSTCLTIALDQSDLIRPLDAAERGAALRRMVRDPSLLLNGETAHELAVRDGHALVVVPRIAATGAGYLLTASLEASGTREVLGQFSRAATNAAGDLYAALEGLATEIRGRVGDPRRAIRQSLPLAQVTTPSLEALRLYTEADRLRTMLGSPLEAVPLLEKAVALDSGFAMAYRAWGKVLNSYLTQWEKQEELSRLAYEHRDRLTGYERLLVEEAYAFQQDRRNPGTPLLDECGRWGPVLALYEGYVRSHPHDPRPLQNLGYNLDRMGRFQEAEEAYRKGVELAPTPGLYNNLIASLLRERRWDEASRVHREWGERFGEEDVRWLLAAASYAERRRDYPALDSLYQVYMEEGYGLDPAFHLGQAGVDAVRGRMTEAWEHFGQAVGKMEAAGDFGAVLPWITNVATIRLVVLGDTAGAIRDVRAATDRLPGDQDPAGAWINVGLLHALAGDTDRARWAVDTLVAIGMGGWSLVGGNLRAAIALAEGRPAEALRLLEDSEIPCWGNPGADPRGDPRWRRILAGRGQEALEDVGRAISSYEGYLTDPPLARPTPLDAIFLFDTMVRLGRLHETLGESTEAADYYLKAAELWKDADPELQPRVRRLRELAAALRATGS